MRVLEKERTLSNLGVEEISIVSEYKYLGHGFDEGPSQRGVWASSQNRAVHA